MLRALSLAMTILAFPFQSSPADERPDQRGNAALIYWQAFANLPRFSQVENQKIGACLTTPLDDSVRKMLTDAEYAFQMLHRGAALPGCDWGLTYEDGIFTRLPHADAARVLTSLACLRGRAHFEAGRSAAAIDDLLAAMTLARHVSLDRSLTTGLVAYNIEQRLIETLALNLPGQSALTLRDLRTRLDALPPFLSQATALLTSEKESLDWFIRKLKGSKDNESALAFLSWVGMSEGKDRNQGEKVRAFLDECGGSAPGVVKFAYELLPCYASTAKMLDLPLDEFEKEFKGQTLERAANPVYKVFFSALPKVRQSRARADVRRALLEAAIAVQLGGPGALKDHRDPASDGPFEYAPFQDGFELRSKLTGQDGKLVALTVGHRS